MAAPSLQEFLLSYPLESLALLFEGFSGELRPLEDAPRSRRPLPVAEFLWGDDVLAVFAPEAGDLVDLSERVFRRCCDHRLQSGRSCRCLMVLDGCIPPSAEAGYYEEEVAGLPVVRFRFPVVRLAALPWDDLLARGGLAAPALAVRTAFPREDRPRLLAAALARLPPLRVRDFVMASLQLQPSEVAPFLREVDRLPAEVASRVRRLWLGGPEEAAGRAGS